MAREVTAAKEATALRDAARAVLETATTNRGNYVDEVADGSEAIILSAAFGTWFLAKALSGLGLL